MFKAISLLIGALFMVQSLQAQERTPKWGKVADEYLQMTSFPDDPEASAVILADYGEVSFNHDLRMEFTVHRRIKILSEAAYDWGTVVVTYIDKHHRVKNFEGQTIIPGAPGKPQKLKVDKKSIFTEKVTGKLRRKKMTLPSLEPGVVIEYRYTIVSDFSGYIPEWEFQDSEPVLWSEYITELPSMFAFVTALRGTLGFDIAESKDTNPNGIRSQRHRWVIKNLPALREEPYMTTVSDYTIRLSVQMSGYYDPSFGTVSMLSSWGQVAKDLNDDGEFGRRLNPSGKLKRLAGELTEGREGETEKIVAIHDYVRGNVEWSGIDGMLSPDSPTRVLDEGSGTSGEINLLLVSMLRAAGFDAHPMLISTRANGMPVEQYPILDQFDYVLAYVQKGKGGLALDATGANRPYNVLPERTLNGRGFVVNEDGEWRDITTQSESRTHLSVRAQLTSEGTVAGTLQFANSGYAAVDVREYLVDEDIDSYFSDHLFSSKPDVELSELTVVSDSLDRHMSTAVFTLTDFAIDGGDYLYINPVLVPSVEENPFKSEIRKFPVDYAYPTQQNYVLELQIPEGFSVVEVPSRRSYSVGSKKAYYNRIVEVHGDVIRLTCRLAIADTKYPARDYKTLRTLYDDVVASEQDQIVLARPTSE